MTRAPRPLAPKAAAEPARPTDAEMLARIRGLAEAKPFRAATLRYTGVRAAQGAGSPGCDEAELHAYRKALELVVAMLGAGIA